MLRAILNKSWRQYPIKHQLYGHLPPISKTIQVGRTRHAGHCRRSRNELISDVLLSTPTYDRAKQDDQLEHTFSSYVRIRDVALKTYRRRWTIGRDGERGSGISVLRHDLMMMIRSRKRTRQYWRLRGRINTRTRRQHKKEQRKTNYRNQKPHWQ